LIPFTLPATKAHAYALSRTMRAEDREEVWARSRQSPLEALMDSIATSEMAFTLKFEDEIAAIWGVRGRGVLDPFACIWGLTGQVVDRFPIAFYRESKKAVALARKQYPFLANTVDARYERSLRWARRLGFFVLKPEPAGVHGELFHPIVLGAT